MIDVETLLSQRVDVVECPLERTCPHPADSLTHTIAQVHWNSSYCLTSCQDQPAKHGLRWWGTHRPIRLFCGLWKVICARGRVCVCVSVLCHSSSKHTHSSTVLRNNWGFKSIQMFVHMNGHAHIRRQGCMQNAHTQRHSQTWTQYVNVYVCVWSL